MSPTTALPRPTATLVNEFLDEWHQSPKMEHYRFQERSIELLFNSLCPQNTDIEQILLKVSVLNDFYSTQIFGTYPVAKHILSIQTDTRLAQGDHSLVDAMASVSINGKARNFYSFASKYCSHHRPKDFAIFDFFVEKLLCEYQATDRFGAFSKRELRSYPTFIQAIKGFRTHYQLESFSLREIDIFLWLAGKRWFPRSYGKPVRAKAGT